MGVWQQSASLPGPRNRSAAVYLANKVYLFGGAPGDGALNLTAFVYDIDANTWSSIASVPEAYLGAAFVVDGKIHVLNASGKHYRYDPATNTWAARAANAVARINAFSFQDALGRIWLIAGFQNSAAMGTVERYDPTTNTWTTLTSVTPPGDRQADYLAGVRGDDGKFYAGYSSFCRELVIFDPVAMTWSRSSEFPRDPSWSGSYQGTVSRLPDGRILMLQRVEGGTVTSRIDAYDPTTNTWTIGALPSFSGNSAYDNYAVATDPAGRILTAGGFNPFNGQTTSAVWLYLQNRTPNAPVLTTMTGGALVSTASPNRAAHVFNDPDEGDSQSMFELRYRKVGTVTWTTVVASVPNPFYDFPAGTFTPGAYERQVRTWDAGGLVGPWCASGFFTADDPPAGPSITYPVNGQDVEQSETMVWSTPDQDVYQVRRVADNGGAPNPAVVYYDSGEIAAPLIRSLPLTFETNDRPEHLQVRVQHDGLWSVYISVMVNVDYTAPMVPTFVVYRDPQTASLLVMVTNPPPVGPAPAVAYNDIYITEGGVEKRRATGLPSNVAWTYWTPNSLLDYAARIRVVAVAANGATSSSTPIGDL